MGVPPGNYRVPRCPGQSAGQGPVLGPPPSIGTALPRVFGKALLHPLLPFPPPCLNSLMENAILDYFGYLRGLAGTSKHVGKGLVIAF